MRRRNLWSSALNRSGTGNDYAQLRSCFPNGSERIRLPVILKMAWAMAGAICGQASSPTPEIHLLLVLRNSTLTTVGRMLDALDELYAAARSKAAKGEIGHRIGRLDNLQ